MQRTLRDLAETNQSFDLSTRSAHVYIYKVFNEIYQLIVLNEREKDGIFKYEAKNDNVLDRYYNAAQLALFVCSQIESGGAGEISKFAAGIKGLKFNDYYVVAGSSQDELKMKELLTSIENWFGSNRTGVGRDELLRLVKEKETPRFAEFMEAGARRCGVSPQISERIYSQFVLEAKIERLEGEDRKSAYYLVYGGRLNAEQANLLAESIDKITDRGANNSSSNGARAYAARMRVD